MPEQPNTEPLPLSDERLAEGLREETEAFAAAIDGVDPGKQVPTCPDWLVRDLVGHIGQAHRWSAGIVRSGSAAEVPEPKRADPGPPEGWRGWLRDGAAELVAAAAEVGAATPVWTFFGPSPARFWLRRMLADTSVHHADAAITSGVDFRIAPDLAADVIDEGLKLLSTLSTPEAVNFKPELVELRGDGQTMALRARSGPAWLITRTPSGMTWRRGEADADATVAGPIEDLMLVFTRRLPADHEGVTITGDRALVDHWLAHTAF